MRKPSADQERRTAVNRLAKSARRNLGPHNHDHKVTPSAKMIDRAIREGRALYSDDGESLLMFEQQQRITTFTDYRGVAFKIPAAAIIIGDSYGPQLDRLLVALRFQVARLRENFQPKVYALTWDGVETAQATYNKAAMPVLAQTVTPRGGILALRGPADQLQDIPSHEHEQAYCLDPDEWTPFLTPKQVRTTREKLAELGTDGVKILPRYLQKIMNRIPGRRLGAYQVKVPGRQKIISPIRTEGVQTPIGQGGILSFYIPLAGVEDCWIHTRWGKRTTRHQLVAGSIFYIDQRRPWQINNEEGWKTTEFLELEIQGTDETRAWIESHMR
jgi:hypothetical protein